MALGARVAHLSFDDRKGNLPQRDRDCDCLLAALALTRVLTSMLVEVKPTDPATFVS